MRRVAAAAATAIVAPNENQISTKRRAARFGGARADRGGAFRTRLFRKTIVANVIRSKLTIQGSERMRRFAKFQASISTSQSSP